MEKEYYEALAKVRLKRAKKKQKNRLKMQSIF